MFTSEPKTIHDAIKPLIYFNCVIGLGAFRLPNISRTIYFAMQLQTALFTLSNLVMTSITFNTIYQVIDVNQISPMALTMYSILVCANSSITVIAPLLLWCRRKVLRDCFRQLGELNDTFQSDLVTENEYKKQYTRLFYHITATISVMVLAGICDTVLNLNVELEMDIRSVLIFGSVAQTLHHPILVMLLLDVNFCTFVRYLGTKFRNINNSLLELTENHSIFCSGKRLVRVAQKVKKETTGNEARNIKNESLLNDKHYSLREIRKAHLGLCKLARNVNSAFGIQNLLSMGISFAMVTGLLYTIYSALSWQNFTNNKLAEVISSTIWAAIYAFKIWLVNHYCWSVSTEAEKTGEVIYELLNSRADKELQCEIHEFGVQMLQNPVQFNACGFFTLHYSFVQGVIGSITTYLVILIQMSHVSETPTYDVSSLVGNSTEISAS